MDLSPWEDVVRKIARDLHQEKYKPDQLSKEAILKTYKELNAGAKKGYGKDWADFSSKEPNDTVLALQKSLFRFSGAKTYAMQLEMQSKMYEGGEIRPYADFEKDVLAINERYNKNYLQAEYQTARQAAHHTRNWEQYQQDKDLFPNLKYKTTGDKRVRDDHAALANIVKPIDDPFWERNYPPNGWRCRCYVVQTAEPASNEDVDTGDIRPEFQINVGKTNELMSSKHQYFALSQDSAAEPVINNQLAHFANSQAREWAKKNLVEPAKKLSNPELEQSVVLSNRDVKTVLAKPHENRVERAWLMKDLLSDFEDAEFIASKPEDKKRAKYITWYYFKSKSGNFYYNLVELATGELKLHAITDNYK